MDKRRMANLRVREDITSALLALMEKKPFPLISVSEIIRRAKVARASYYRNFSSKEDVLTRRLEDMLADFAATADYDLTQYRSYENILHAMNSFARHREELVCIHRNGFSDLCLETLNRFLEQLAGDMPHSSTQRYELYFFTGALYNVAIQWMSDDCRDSAEEVARAFHTALLGQQTPP